MPIRKQTPLFVSSFFLFLFAFLFLPYAACVPPSSNETTAETKADASPDATPETSEPKPEAQAEPKPEPRPEPKPEPRPEPKPEAQAEPKPEPRPEPKPESPSEIPDAPEASQETVLPEPSAEVITEPTGPLPTAEITEPKANDILTGKISIKVTASVTGSFSIERVELHLNGSKTLELYNPPYNFDYDTARLPDGSNTIKAIAFTSGLQRAEKEISVITTNKGPEITFNKPKESEAFSGSFDVEVSVKDAVALKTNGVTLRVDGQILAWSSTSPVYKATVNPAGKPFDSLPLEVTAENQKSIRSQKQIWISYDPAPGSIAAGAECNNSDPQKRCIAGYSCLIIPTLDPKSLCYKNCLLNGPANQCPAVPGQTARCEPAQMGTTRGACVNLPRPPGTIYSKCGGVQACNAGLLCVGVSGSDSFCLETCSNLNQPCPTQGFSCLPINGGPCSTSAQCPGGMACTNNQCTGGACVEKCEQTCTQDTDCTLGQSCTSGKCAAPYCGTYGKCTAVGLPFKVCI